MPIKIKVKEQKKYRERPTGPIHGAWEAECLRAHTVIVTQSAGVGLCGSVCIHTVLNLHRALFHVCTSLFLSVSPAKFANFIPLRGQKRAPLRGAETGGAHRPKGPKHRCPHKKTAPRQSISRRTHISRGGRKRGRAGPGYRSLTFHLALGHWAVAPWNCLSCVSSLQSLEISRKFENSRPEKKLKNLEFCHHADCVRFQKTLSVPWTRATTHADHLTASAHCVEPSLPRTRPFRLSLLFNIHYFCLLLCLLSRVFPFIHYHCSTAAGPPCAVQSVTQNARDGSLRVGGLEHWEVNGYMGGQGGRSDREHVREHPAPWPR